MKNLSLIFFLFFFSCVGSKKLETEHKDKLSISFFSIGSGIDYQKKIEYDKFIENFQKNEKVSLVVAKSNWGKEGEEDYCIDLKTLSKNKQEKFIEGSKQLLSTGAHIRITEVDSCSKH